MAWIAAPRNGFRISQVQKRSLIYRFSAFFSTIADSNDLSLNQSTSSVPSLNVPLSTDFQVPVLPDRPELAKTHVTTLSNGFRLGSENSKNPCVSVALLVGSGCIREDSSNFGVTHLLEKMAFKTTKNRTQERFVQDVQAIGLNMTVHSVRDQMVYMGHGIKTFLPQITEILIDSVRNASFEDSEVEEQMMNIRFEVEQMKNNPHSLLLDNLHIVGYSGDYSRSFFASESSLSSLDKMTLRKFVDKNFTASNMVLAAAGVDHNDFISIAEPLLVDLPKAPPAAPPKFQYLGGEWRQHEALPMTHFALAFEVPNGWKNEHLANRLTVLKFLLGGGESFSTGGPGKGMYTRFYRHILQRFSQFESVAAFSSIYNDTGLFGVHACMNSEFVGRGVDTICKELLSVANYGKVTELEFQRAKNATISSVLMSLESQGMMAEDIAAQVLSYGYRRPVSEFVGEIQSLTLQDIQKAAIEIFSTPPTVAVYGAVDDVPNYNVFGSRFRM